ncbi:DEAD/DEAH box helicase family protein [Lonepinella koalarum]|uniref:DEAD/DEAH box helicase family protein n=1 Tax=Lonepinella koalarum TaxID=53417 RepID=UPI003F6E07CE
MKTLLSEVENRKTVYIDDGDNEKFAIPEFISQNLKYPLFEWQQSAVQNFLIFERINKISAFPELKNQPTHLLFQMATGAGKTLVMAALMLYYYQKGYRHFLFFVNQNNIVDKTESNFADSTHAKYLFQPKIMQGETVIPVKKVERFSQNPQGIEIKFSSIQKLYNDVRIEKENQTTLNDLQKLNIVMLADEAHHLNSQTKKGQQIEINLTAEITGKTKESEIEAKGWEYMVLNQLLHKNGKASQNVLLEFTATLPENAEVQAKYADKIITQFDLKAFILKKHTKEINLISSTLNKKERILHALLFAWYRHQVALKYDIANFKPVMLFRSKDIASSWQDYAFFMQLVKDCSAQDFDFLNHLQGSLTQHNDDIYVQGKTRTEQALQFMQRENLSSWHIAEWVKNNYQDRNVIITNSKTNTKKSEQTDADTERLLNNLEAANNPVRAIFTVDRLTEGWDVLNLFDIVRLYEGQNSGGSTKKTPETTIKEKQLIGRGVRYYPFEFADKPKYQRKFDNELNHDLRILEELFYYTFDEKSRYISELKVELRKSGFLTENENKVLATFALKSAVKNSQVLQNWLIWGNRKIPNPNAKQHNVESLQQANEMISYQIRSQQITETHLDWQTEQDQDLRINEQMASYVPSQFIANMEKHIFDKALHIKGKAVNSLFHFCNLQQKLGLTRRNQLQQDVLANWKILWQGNKAPQADDKLQACLKVLDRMETLLAQTDTPFIGSQTFNPKSLGDIFTPKQKYVEKNALNPQLAEQYDWFMLDNFAGTSSEQALIELIEQNMANLTAQFDVHLLRNEEIYKIYDFKNGQGFQPDFLLLLKSKQKQPIDGREQHLCYQILIEPKGEHIKDNDQWKQDFLLSITEKYGKAKPINGDFANYRVIGLPFFVQAEQENFYQALNEVI